MYNFDVLALLELHSFPVRYGEIYKLVIRLHSFPGVRDSRKSRKVHSLGIILLPSGGEGVLLVLECREKATRRKIDVQSILMKQTSNCVLFYLCQVT